MPIAAINNQHALEEFIGNLDSGDMIKARLVLDHFTRLGEAVQRRILFELNRRDDHNCLALLLYLSVTNPTAQAQYPDIPESILAKALENPHLILSLIRSSHGEEQRYCIELARKINFASPTALQRLAEFLGKDEAMDMLILDIVATIQDDLSLEILNKTLQSRSAVLRNYSKAKLIALGSKAVPLLSANLTSPDPDLQIHSLNALLLIGDESAVRPIRKLITTLPQNANVRFAAFEALANLPIRKGDYIWASGLLDPESNIRLAAARAIERTLDDILAAGIRNMVKSQDEEALQVVRAVLDSQAENIFLNLIRHDIGLELITDYLATQAHPEIRQFFVQILAKAGYTDLAQAILEESTRQPGTKKGAKVCAVDDSRMVLSIYRSVLNELGYDPELFHNPETALAWLACNPVQFLCTDLNMPEMTGIDLTRALRKLYDKNQLPIIMVTTQNDLRDSNDALAAGVNCIAAKPFDALSLQAAITTIGLLAVG